jgi:hypothetical protein
MRAWKNIVLLLFILSSSYQTTAETLEEICLDKAKSFFAKLDKDLSKSTQVETAGFPRHTLDTLDSSHIFFSCHSTPGLADAVVLAHWKAKWELQSLGEFYCLEIQKTGLRGIFIHKNACPSMWYHEPACETYRQKFIVENGTLKFLAKDTSIKEMCKTCKKLGSCSVSDIREASKKLHLAGDSASAYKLLKDYYDHFETGLTNSSAGVDPWFAVDMLLVAAKAKTDCSFALDVVRQARQSERWNEAASKSADFNERLCQKMH